jgi:hypothetical protein
MELENRKIVIFLEAKVSGKLNMMELAKKFQLNVLSKKDKSGRVIYRNLQERNKYVFGYPFWTPDENFNLENHIDSYPSTTDAISPNELDSVRKELRQRRFNPEDRSPWQLTLINVNDNGVISTVVFFRIHHVLGDGHALFYLLTQLVDQTEVSLLKSKQIADGGMSCSAILTSLKAPYNIVKGGMNLYFTGACPWPDVPTNTRVSAISNHISLADIKAAGREAKVGVTTVLMAGIAQGLLIAPKSLFTLKNEDFLLSTLMIRLPSRKALKMGHPMFVKYYIH